MATLDTANPIAVPTITASRRVRVLVARSARSTEKAPSAIQNPWPSPAPASTIATATMSAIDARSALRNHSDRKFHCAAQRRERTVVEHERGMVVGGRDALELVDEVGDGARVAGGLPRRQGARGDVDRVGRARRDVRPSRFDLVGDRTLERRCEGRVRWCHRPRRRRRP